jgi:hypothetical protein
MKKVLVFCVLLSLALSLDESSAWAIDVGWMQKGVRVWYFGAVGSTTSSDAEEAYLFGDVNGNNVQVTKHSGMNHWATSNAPDTSTYSFLGKGPCWINPQVLQNLQSGDNWKGQVISTVLRESHTYDTFKAMFSFPYLLLPIKTLFDLKSQRDLVKIVYYIDGFSTGIAYFDADTGLLLLYETSSGYVTVFFILSEINYDFATRSAFAEDNGPHTGFKSSVLEQQMMPFPDVRQGYAFIQSSVESRYGGTVQTWVSTSDSGNISSYMPPYENYCFFGSVPVLRRIDMTQASNYPPEQWNEYGQYLWWWVPTAVLQHSTINVFGVPMTRTSTNPYTFAATQQPAGLFFTKLWFDNDGYMTKFAAKDSTTGLDIDPDRTAAAYYQNSTTVNGLSYYKNTMGTATPVDLPSKIGVFRPSIGMWFLDRSGNGSWNDCATDKCVNFGIQGDVQVTGDWNGDGTTKIGVFRPSIGWWFLDYNGNGQWDGCSTDRCYNFGISEDTPVTGDWNGDGKTEIGVFRKSIGWWFLDYNADGTWSGCSADRCFNFGISEDTPVTGDWNGDGKTEIGVFRPSIGWWFVDVNGDGTWSGCGVDGCYNFGISVDLPVTGDWNGDGFTEIGVFRPSIGWWFLDYNGNDTWNDCTTDRCYQFGISVDLPVSGAF